MTSGERTHLARGDGVDGVDLEGDVLVWTGTELHLLSGGAAHVWRGVTGTRTADEIVALAAQDTGTTEDLIRADVHGVVDQLVASGLVVERNGSPGPRWSVPDGVGWVFDGDQVVVSRHGSGTRDALSVTAARIFRLAGDGVGLHEIVGQLESEYVETPDDLAAVVLAVLEQLESAGYLRRTGTP